MFVDIDIVIPSLSMAAGGPTRTVVQLCIALASYGGAEVRLISQQKQSDAEVLLPREKGIEIYIERSTPSVSFKLGLSGRKALHETFAQRRPQILHSNGIWHPLNHWATSAARRHQIPLVIHPRGMLEPWALGWRATKKRLALAVYQQRDLESAALLIATADQEAENFRRLGLRQPIAVIPNGVDLEGGRAGSFEEVAFSGGKRRALFLSRVHPIKGLQNLLKAWAATETRDWILQIAGPDEGNHLRDVLELAQQLGISDQVQWLGEIDDQSKWGLYRSADLFVLPTFSENFGVVVAEALSQGLPVITTTGAPWRDLQTHGCGWWVEPTEMALHQALNEAVALPTERLVEMGRHGRNYVQRYEWSIIAGQMCGVYRWMLGQGSMPDCIRLD